MSDIEDEYKRLFGTDDVPNEISKVKKTRKKNSTTAGEESETVPENNQPPAIVVQGNQLYWAFFPVDMLCKKIDAPATEFEKQAWCDGLASLINHVLPMLGNHLWWAQFATINATMIGMRTGKAKQYFNNKKVAKLRAKQLLAIQTQAAQQAAANVKQQ